MEKLVILSAFLGLLTRGKCDGALPDEKVESISGVSGNTTTLPCPLNPRSHGDIPKLILWYKRGEKTPLFSYDIRQHGQRNNESLKNRQLTIDPKTAKLTFISLTVADAGLFECRVDFSHSPTITNLVNLTVIEAPQSVDISDETFGLPSGGVLGPYQEGQNTIVKCLAHGGNPKPKLVWREGSTILNDTSPPVDVKSTIQSDLFLHLTRRWHNKTIRCSAINSPLLRPVVATARISIYLLPTSVQITYKEKPATEGSEIEVTCLSRGSRPPADLSWSLRDTRTGDKQATTKGPTSSRSSIKIRVTKKHNRKEIICEATNPSIPNSRLSNSTLFIVHYAPSAKALLGPSLRPSLLKEGDDVYFVCEVDANPVEDEIRWFHEGTELFQKVSDGVLLSSNSLVLQNMKRHRAGKYTCAASNYLGSITSSPVFLKVKYKPECVTSPTTYFIYDQPINVTCTVSSHPVATKMNWRWNSGSDVMNIRPFSSVLERTTGLMQPSPSSSSSSTEDGTTAGVLSVFPSKNSEDRELSCWAENEMGVQSIPCTFSIKVAQIPAPLSSCRLANVTSSSLSLTCERPQGIPSESTYYRAELYLHNKTLFSNVTSTRPNFNVSSLDPGTSYEIKVYVSRGPVTSLPVVVSASTFRQSRVEASTSGTALRCPEFRSRLLIILPLLMSSVALLGSPWTLLKDDLKLPLTS